jgi:hypothetical protein
VEDIKRDLERESSAVKWFNFSTGISGGQYNHRSPKSCHTNRKEAGSNKGNGQHQIMGAKS